VSFLKFVFLKKIKAKIEAKVEVKVKFKFEAKVNHIKLERN
jgi:hypothetical protein